MMMQSARFEELIDLNWSNKKNKTGDIKKAKHHYPFLESILLQFHSLEERRANPSKLNRAPHELKPHVGHHLYRLNEYHISEHAFPRKSKTKTIILL